MLRTYLTVRGGKAVRPALQVDVGENAFQDFGTQFPVSVKTMDVKARTPLRVNVPDDIARQRYDAFGKTALWYILSADPDATLYLGFSREVEAEDFYRRCLAGKVDDVLHAVHPKAGQTYLIPPCTVYAAGPGLKILEVSEASELALRVYDPGHDDELEEAFDFIDFRPASTIACRGLPPFSCATKTGPRRP